jgi:probable HAF family extracellular repeat protein
MSMTLATLWLCASASQGTAQTYTITDLGALAGESVSQAYALNNAGEVAGDSSAPTGATATMFSGGKTTNVSPDGSNENFISEATAINSSGEIAGWSFEETSVVETLPQPFIYSNGSVQIINTSTLFPFGATPTGINDSGEVVGTGEPSSDISNAFLYSGSKITILEPSETVGTSASAINASGQIVGNYYSSTSGAAGTFLYTNGSMTTIPNPANSIEAIGDAINANGEIVGELYPTAGGAHAAKFSGGVWTDLGNLTGAVASHATAVNTAGEIVGTAIFPPIYKPSRPGKHVPFISTTAGLVNLNTLIPSGSGFTLTDAVAINVSGQILCDATNASGHEHAVLLSLK